MIETVHERINGSNFSTQDELDAEAVRLCVENGISRQDLLEAFESFGSPWTEERLSNAVELACNMPVFDSPGQQLIRLVATRDKTQNSRNIFCDAPQHYEIPDEIATAALLARDETGRVHEKPSETSRELGKTAFITMQKPDENIREQGLCAQTDPEAFFPEKGGSTKEAKKVCLSCDIREECLELAIQNDERFGIWGGMSERERRKYKKTLLTQAKV